MGLPDPLQESGDKIRWAPELGGGIGKGKEEKMVFGGMEEGKLSALGAFSVCLCEICVHPVR